MAHEDTFESVSVALYQALRALHRKYNDRKGIQFLLDEQCRAALRRFEAMGNHPAGGGALFASPDLKG